MFWLRVGTLGLGYLASQTVWALYNAYLPLLYERFIASNALIGLIMVIDNIASISAQPGFAALSDRTSTRLGRRLPYLLAGVPLAAVFFALIPRAPTLGTLLAATLLMNLGIAIFTTPSYALMADITPAPRMGRANGIMNTMGGLGALIAFFALNPLYDRNPALPFDLTALLLGGALILILLAVPERRLSLVHGPRAATPGGEHVRLEDLGGVLRAARGILARSDRSLLYLLLGALCWVAAVNGAQNMFTRYGVHHLGLTPGQATFMLGFFALAFIVCSVPAGLAGDRIGRVAAIRTGAVGILVTFALMSVVSSPGAARLVFLLGGVSWALIIINAYPVLMDLTPRTEAGTYTGIWNVVIALAGLISPPLYGWVVDSLGFQAFFLPGIVFLALALLFSLRIRWSRPPGADPGAPPVPGS